MPGGLARLGGLVMLLARHLRHLAVEELQERLVVDALLGQEGRELAVEAHPH